MRRLTLLALLLLVACEPLSLLRREKLEGALYPQVSRVVGRAWIKPRYSHDPQPLSGPTVLEPGDWIQTDDNGKVEILLPEAVLRIYSHTQAQVLFSFQHRTAVARNVEIKEGEVLIRSLTQSPFVARTEGLEVEARTPAAFLAGVRGPTHHAACYQGAIEGRNIRVRGQTIVKLVPGHRLVLDDGPTTAALQTEKLADEWHRWEREEIFSSGLVPLPLPPPARTPATSVP